MERDLGTLLDCLAALEARSPGASVVSTSSRLTRSVYLTFIVAMLWASGENAISTETLILQMADAVDQYTG